MIGVLQSVLNFGYISHEIFNHKIVMIEISTLLKSKEIHKIFQNKAITFKYSAC